MSRVAQTGRKPRTGLGTVISVMVVTIDSELTLAHLTQCAQAMGRELSTEAALDFLNQNGRAYEMWKRMMHAGEEYVRSALQARTATADGHTSRPDGGKALKKGCSLLESERVPWPT